MTYPPGQPGGQPPGYQPPGQPGGQPPGYPPPGYPPPGYPPPGYPPPGQPPSGGFPAQPVPPGQFPPGSVPPGQFPPGQPPYPPQGYPPQPGYPQAPYPGQPYPGQPGLLPPTAGTTITAASLMSAVSIPILLTLFRALRVLFGGHHVAPLYLIEYILFVLVLLAVIATTIVLWLRLPIARLIGIIVLSLYLATLIFGELLPFSKVRPAFGGGAFWLPQVVLGIAALVLVCLPPTARYLASRRRPPMPPGPGYPPQQPGYPPQQ